MKEELKSILDTPITIRGLTRIILFIGFIYAILQ